MKTLGFIVLVLGTLLTFKAAGGGAEGPSPRYGGRLVFGIAKDITSLNPFYRTQSTDSFVRDLTFQTLLDLDKKGQPIASLAESWTISPDGKTYRFQLRRGVKFHNDKELTAEDVKWSIEYALNPKIWRRDSHCWRTCGR